MKFRDFLIKLLIGEVMSIEAKADLIIANQATILNTLGQVLNVVNSIPGAGDVSGVLGQIETQVSSIQATLGTETVTTEPADTVTGGADTVAGGETDTTAGGAA